MQHGAPMNAPLFVACSSRGELCFCEPDVGVGTTEASAERNLILSWEAKPYTGMAWTKDSFCV